MLSHLVIFGVISICNNNSPIVRVSLAFKISCMAQTESVYVATEVDLLVRNVPGVVGSRYVRNVPIVSVSVISGQSPTLWKTRETEARNLSVRIVSHFKSASVIDGDSGLKSWSVRGEKSGRPLLKQPPQIAGVTGRKRSGGCVIWE
jgi:hypothetical protein